LGETARLPENEYATETPARNRGVERYNA